MWYKLTAWLSLPKAHFLLNLFFFLFFFFWRITVYAGAKFKFHFSILTTQSSKSWQPKFVKSTERWIDLKLAWNFVYFYKSRLLLQIHCILRSSSLTRGCTVVSLIAIKMHLQICAISTYFKWISVYFCFCFLLATLNDDNNTPLVVTQLMYCN